MNEDKIRQLVKEMLDEQNSSNVFNTMEVPNHTHNGTDSPRISQANIVAGTKYSLFITEDASETIFITGVYNATRLVFNGFAANNASGGSASARCILIGEVNFGETFGVTQAGNTITVDQGGDTRPFAQSASSMYTNTGSLSNTRVSASNLHFAYSTDNSSEVVASLSLVSYDNGILMIEAVVGSNFLIQGALTIY